MFIIWFMCWSCIFFCGFYGFSQSTKVGDGAFNGFLMGMALEALLLSPAFLH